jgi:transketolase
MADTNYLNKFNELESISLKVRESIIQLATNGGCFLGASLSCVELIVYLYKKFLNINKNNLQNDLRDYFFLSKGHDVPALYSTLAEVGILEKKRLQNHLSVNDFIYWHPNVNNPGIEFHSGSLGHILSIAMGVAYDCKIKKQKNKIVVLLGDGELNEGSIWEASLVASAFQLNNLIAVVDRNYFQANMRTEELIPLDSIVKKFEAFNWNVTTCDGHDFFSIEEAFSSLSSANNLPSVVIADTVRGKGLPSIEEKSDRWFCNFSQEEIKSLTNELHTQNKSTLISETMVVR